MQLCNTTPPLPIQITRQSSKVKRLIEYFSYQQRSHIFFYRLSVTCLWPPSTQTPATRLTLSQKTFRSAQQRCTDGDVTGEPFLKSRRAGGEVAEGKLGTKLAIVLGPTFTNKTFLSMLS